MKRRYKLHNGWYRETEYQRSLLVEIGPETFDPFHRLEYERGHDGAYIFSRKRDFEAAVANLKAAGYFS
jgi:hypothetical protein